MRSVSSRNKPRDSHAPPRELHFGSPSRPDVLLDASDPIYSGHRFGYLTPADTSSPTRNPNTQSAPTAMSIPTPLLSAYAPFPLEIDRAEGCDLISTDGKRYLDLYGGHCVCLLGHNPPALIDALNAQMRRITFYSTALKLPERDQAARDLLSVSPEGFDRVLFVNSGAEANENALKFACAYTKRSVVIAIEGAFHGRTAAADAVTGSASRVIHFPRAPFEVRWLKFGDVEGLETAISPGDVAAVILEPVQSMAGCRVHPPAFVARLNALAQKHGTLLIADEVQGGLGRCLTNWSHQAIGLDADLFTSAKGIGAGFPVGALVVHGRLAEPGKGLFGTTFGGGPLAAAAVSTVCAAVRDPSFRANVSATSAEIDRIATVPGVAEVLGIGLLRGVRIRDGGDSAPGTAATKAKSELFARGFIVGGSNDPQVLRLLPPLTLTPKQARGFVEALGSILAK